MATKYQPRPSTTFVTAKRIRLAQAKGRPPLRRCPDDFDVIFVEIGRLDCEPWYRASRRTINRWLDERGKTRLIQLRAAYVRHLRNQAGSKATKPQSVVATDTRRIDPRLASLAAQFLRCARNGGWMVSQTKDGDWWVGLGRRSPAQMLDMAERKGFDVEQANLHLEAERAVA